ncbi:uncharacterized protein LOC125780131 [Bactrocera dorsalis]|uniref:Uncharacterized protein LOC125780131 n=1 Tax=Bactrocera dorsalis TaxID=27457 RepID=A0ABM3K8D1_BACDO|nr:uncharacterized protein LOC125780131 [Bactrocera dorsalis]
MLPNEQHPEEDITSPISSFTPIPEEDAKRQIYGEDEDTADFQETIRELKYRQLYKTENTSRTIMEKIAFYLLLTTTIMAQQIDIQDLTNNNGYIPIKTDELRVIDHYDKILHFVNLTAYDETTFLISRNIEALTAITFEDKQLLDTLHKNFILLRAKIDNLHPHLKTKRGLVNILGKGLRFIAGTMDSEDEEQVNDALSKIHQNNQIMENNIGNLTYFNNILANQISNITSHIN